MRRFPMLVFLLVGVAFDAGRSVAHEGSGVGAGVAPAPQVSRSLDGLTQRLLQLHSVHQRTSDADVRRNAHGELLAVAASRQQRLAAVIEDHPGEVLRAAVSARLRGSLPSEVQPYVEEEVTLEGELEVLHADSPTGDRYFHWLTLGNSRLSLHFDGTPPVLETGDHVRLRGWRVRQALALDSNQAQVTVLAAAVPNTFGAQNTAVLLLSFQNQPSVTSVSSSQASSVAFSAGTSVSNFFREASYQRTWLTGNVFGPYVIPLSSSGCDYWGIASAAEQAAAAAGVNLSAYPRRVFAFPSNGCGWWGLGTVGGKPSRAWINGSFTNGVVAHEMGHNLGLYHSHALECGSVVLGGSCSNIEYGDTLDVMGSASPPKHFNAPQKERLGWLNDGASPPITTVQANGVYTIDPYESLGSAPKALKMQTPSGDWYYVEYRQPIGFDASTVSSNTNVRNGVVVHWVDNGNPSAIFLLDMTPSTSSWSDPALGVNQVYSDPAAGIAIAPVWVNATSAGVNITVGTSSCVRQNPTVTVSPAQQQGAPGVTVKYTVSVRNNDTGCTASTFSQQAAVPTGWTAIFASSTLTISPAATVATTLSVKPPPTVSSGTYTIAPMAMNAAVPSYTGSTTAMYAIPGSSTPGSFTDNFNRADSSNLGSAWTEVGGNLRIEAGQLRSAASRSLHAAIVPGVAGATQHVAVSFAATNTNSAPRFGLFVRYQDADNYYACYRQTGGSSVLRIVRVVDGVGYLLKSTEIPNPPTDELWRLGCRAEGSKITLELNGTDRINAVDSTYGRGKVGLFMGYRKTSGSKVVSHRADDFSATAQ